MVANAAGDISTLASRLFNQHHQSHALQPGHVPAVESLGALQPEPKLAMRGPPASLDNVVARAFHRQPLVSRAQLERATSILGNTARLRRKLRSGRPVTLAAIGASNVVRGGCQEWQGSSKCTHPKYTNRSSDDGTHKGWLLQAFDALNATWPHPGNVLVNHGLMATGPSGFLGCLNTFVPESADVVYAAPST